MGDVVFVVSNMFGAHMRTTLAKRLVFLRYFLSIALRIPTAQDFRHERVHVQNVRDFPQTKLDSEINAPFLRLKEHGEPRLFSRYLLRKVK